MVGYLKPWEAWLVWALTPLHYGLAAGLLICTAIFGYADVDDVWAYHRLH